MQIVNAQSELEQRLAAVLPDLRPPAALLRQLADGLRDEEVVLACGDLRPLGFGAYEGQLCLITPTRVLLATASSLHGPDGFGIEEWDRRVSPLPQLRPRRVAPPAPRQG